MRIENNISYIVESILDEAILHSDRDIGIELVNNSQDSAIFIACRKEQSPIHYLIPKMILIDKLKPNFISKKGYNIFTEYVTENLNKCDFCCLNSRICYNLFIFCLGYDYNYTKPIFVQKLNKTFPNMLHLLLSLNTPYTEAFVCKFIKQINIEIDYQLLEKAAEEHSYICMGALLESNKLENMDLYPNKKEIFENIFAKACYNTDINPYYAEKTSIDILSFSTNFDKRKSLLELHNLIIQNKINLGVTSQFLANEDWIKELALYDRGIFEIDKDFAYTQAFSNELDRVCEFILQM